MYNFEKGDDDDLFHFCEVYSKKQKCLHPLSLSIEDCKVNDAVLKSLNSILKKCVNIKDFRAKNMNFSGARRCHQIMSGVGSRVQGSIMRGDGQHLLYLELVECYLKDDDVRFLANCITAIDRDGYCRSPLVTLNLKGNRFGDVGAKALSLLLYEGSSLQQLDCTSNRIGDEGVSVLAEVLQQNCSLKVLHLGNNRICHEGCKLLAQALNSEYGNSTLEELHLGNNRIGASGTSALCQALKGNLSLKVLDLCSNGIGDVGATMLANLAETNATLKEIKITGNSIGLCCCKGCILKRVNQDHFLFGMNQECEYKN